MSVTIEKQEVRYIPEQNAALSANFFKHTGIKADIVRVLIADRESYIRFRRAFYRPKTQYEPQSYDALASTDPIFNHMMPPFDLLETKTTFSKDGKNIMIHEILDKPNGLTKKCLVGDKCFDSYLEAENFVVEEFRNG